MMRISINEARGEELQIALNTKVWLDGAHQDNVTEIDTDAGYVVRYLTPMRVGADGCAKTEKVFGNIETARMDIGFGA